MLKAFAIREGLVADDGMSWERRVKRKLDIEGAILNLPDVFPTLDILTSDTKEKIKSGEGDIGTPIVLIELRVKKVNAQGKVETVTTQLYGRAFSLQQIMDRTLKKVDAAGLLRPLYPEDSDITQVLEDLSKKGNFKWTFAELLTQNRLKLCGIEPLVILANCSIAIFYQ